MSHCPQCGKPSPMEGAIACPFCGAKLAAAARAPIPAGRTMVGVAASALVPKIPDAAPAGAGGSKANRTIVGMPAKDLARAEPSALAGSPAAIPAANRTMVGLAATLPLGSPKTQAAAPAGIPDGVGATLVGVAHPGIAPLRPGEEAPAEDDDPTGYDEPPAGYEAAGYGEAGYRAGGYEAAGELGATIGPSAGGPWAPPPAGKLGWEGGHKRVRLRGGIEAPGRAAKKKPDPAPRRALAVVITAGGLALVAVLVAVFWPSPPPITARARADAEGREGVELRCPTCPDGTTVTIDQASATMAGGVALVPRPSALSIGQNRMRVAVDRPGGGRDETVALVVNVAYRIRPDLAALQGDRPSIQIIAEAAAGTTIAVDGKTLPLSGGRAVETIDVTESCTGLSAEAKTLGRQIPYVVTPPDGPAERGIVNVSVGVAPLQIDAPGPRVTIDGPSFVLEGRTMKGAEVLAAGRPIAVRPDGTFAQVMNVSSVGATQIEVRARLAGLAPRLAQIKVRRVDNLETAAREFLADKPIGFGPLAASLGEQIGKAVALSGEILETKAQGHRTVMLLDVSTASGCPKAGACTARLVQGAESKAQKGDALRVFGRVARAFPVPGRPDVPEIEVDFTLKGAK